VAAPVAAQIPLSFRRAYTEYHTYAELVSEMDARM
jgi:hypothetical protein